MLQGKNLYFEVFYTCQLITLARKYTDINRMGNEFGNKFAIDYYGFLTMNERYFPKRWPSGWRENLVINFIGISHDTALRSLKSLLDRSGTWSK